MAVVSLPVDVEVTAVDSEEDVVEVTAVESDDEISEIPGRSVSDSSAPPLRFRGYRRGRELGRGASGQVFVCKKKSCTSGFAVKAVSLRRMRLSSNAEREQKKLRREVDILKRLPPHQNIVQLIDAFEEGDWFLLILELVGGGDLFTVLTDREPPRLLEREAAYVLQQLADGLSFLHGQGVIHRDLKLENVLVASERRERSGNGRPLVFYNVKITDFGMSKAVGAGLSDAKSRVGTRPYSAPEVWGEEAYDFSSDLWSLGVLLYVLLAGHFPFSNTPIQQPEVAKVIDRIKDSSNPARALVGGLLQIDAKQRLSLEALCSHDWLRAEGTIDLSERAAKRQRCEAKVVDVPPSPSVTASVPVTEIIGSPQRPSPEKEERLLDAEAAPLAVVSPAQDGVPSPEVVTVSPSPAGDRGATAPAPEHPAQPAVAPPEVPATRHRPAQSPPQAPHNPGDTKAAGWLNLSLPIKIHDVLPRSKQPGVMQVHMAIASRFVAAVVGADGKQLQTTASDAGCQVWMKASEKADDHRIVMMGNYSQCSTVQQFVHRQIADVVRSEGQEMQEELEVVLLVRAEAAGVVIGKQGYVVKKIRKQSGAKVQLLREEVESQRPCIITGTLANVLQAERHVFDLVRAVPVVEKDWGKDWAWGREWGGPNLPRTRISAELFNGKIVSWKGRVGWIAPEKAIDHPKASAHQGRVYLHEKDCVGGRPMSVGQLVVFHVYSDKTGLGAEDCVAKIL